MDRIYVLSSITIMLAGFLNAFSAANVWLAVFITPFAIIVSASLVRFVDGRPLNSGYDSLPIIRLMAWILKDGRIAREQNSRSLSLLLFISAFVLAADLSLFFFSDVMRPWLLFMGCLVFSAAFSVLMVSRYTMKQV